MKRLRPSARAIVIAAIIDVILVLVFVLIGRSSHGEDLGLAGVLETLWPFAAGLAVGWIVTLAWRAPTGLVLPGLPIWAITVAVGMVLRIVARQGVELSFVIVASVVLAIFLLGWRALALAARSIRRRRSA